MPEGPEIRRMADRIEKALFRSAFSHAEFPLHPPLAARLRGASPQRIDTRGKALLIRFNQGLTLYTYNQLYG
jgi:endonuclease-8